MILEKQELKYIGMALAFAFVWMVLIVPYLMNQSFTSNYLIAFLIFNVAVFVIIQVVFKAVTLNHSVSFVEVLGLILVANGIDLLLPPYQISMLGQISSNIMLGTSSTDFVVGTLWQSIGTTGIVTYIATYCITPVLLFIGAGLLMKNFVRRM
jgi:hypothetical protein